MGIKAIFYMLLTCGALFSQARAEQASADSKQEPLKAACAALLVNPHDPAGIQGLLDYSRQATGVPQLKSNAMAAYALVALANGNTNLFERAQLSHRANFPADRSLIKLSLDECISRCDACSGNGFTEQNVACEICKGSGKCLACGGTGKWQTRGLASTRNNAQRQAPLLNCSRCKGTGRCGNCESSSIQRTKCTACQGAGTKLELPTERVLRNLRDILSDISSTVQKEERIGERIRLAKAEPDVNIRIQLLERLLGEVKNRAEAPEIERLLLADKHMLECQATAKRQAEDLKARELASLRAFKNTGDPQAANQTLRAYLAANPNSPHKLEVQSIIDENESKIASQRKRTRLLYGIGATALALLGVSCVNINFIRYSILPSGSSGRRR